jgi:Na+/citrate or Na+/malate symporter
VLVGVVRWPTLANGFVAANVKNKTMVGPSICAGSKNSSKLPIQKWSPAWPLGTAVGASMTRMNDLVIVQSAFHVVAHTSAAVIAVLARALYAMVGVAIISSGE